MIIVPHEHARKTALDLYPDQTILVIQQWQHMLLEQTKFSISNPAIISNFLLNTQKPHLISKIEQHIQFIFQNALALDTLKTSLYPNSKWIAHVTLELQQYLRDRSLIHPCEVATTLADHAHSIDPLYDQIQSFGFQQPNLSTKIFLNRFTDPIDHKYPKANIHINTFKNPKNELDESIKWLAKKPDHTLLHLDPEQFSPFLHLNTSIQFHHGIVSQKSQQNPVIKHCVSITSPAAYIQQSIIPFLSANKAFPDGLNIHKPFNTSEYAQSLIVPLSNWFSYKHSNIDHQATMTVQEFLKIVLKTFELWNIRRIIKTPEIKKHLDKKIAELNSLSLYDIKHTYGHWHRLFAQLLLNGNINAAQGPQILSAQKIEGARVSTLWISGAQCENWKRTIKMPWLPPETATQYDYSYLLESADEIILSFQENNCDGEENLAPKGIDSHFNRHDKQCNTLQVTSRDNWETQVLTDSIQGGVTLVKDYATCPFKAFARFRLKLNAKQPYSLAILPNHLGNIVHNSLESLYKNIRSQSELEHISPNSIEAIIAQAWKKHSHPIHPNIRKILETSCSALLQQWVETDRSRPYFQIMSLEKTFHLQLGEHIVKIRMDRIDTINNKPILIDYKTGQASITDVFTPDFTSPQMALYALTQSSSPEIAYAKLTMKGCSWQSVDLGCHDSLLKGQQAKANTTLKYDELVNQWREKATSLLNQYQDGQYPASPSKAQHCAKCEFTALCRYNDNGEYHAETH